MGVIRRIFRDIYCNKLCSSYLIPDLFRRRLYKLWGGVIGNSTIIAPHCFVGNPTNLKIGEGTFINYYTFLDTSEKIVIGNNCSVGMNVTFITATHEVGSFKRRADKTISMAISVGDGCWIGANSTILPGVHIGDGSIVAAGSVVVSDVEPNSLYAGVPARKIKDLN